MHLAALLTLVAIFASGEACAQTLSAGFGHVPPLHYRDPHGSAAGFAVDVLNEAARREGIQIAWKRVGGSNDIERALTDGRIDVFPAALVTDARRSRFHFSDPWWSEDLTVLGRSDLQNGSSSDWRGRRIALATPAYESVASRVLPGAHFEVPKDYDRRGGSAAAASMVCQGESDGALMSHSEADELLMRRPPACAAFNIQIFETPESLPLAIMTRRESQALADRLYRRIDEMLRDGTLAAIATRYPRIPVRSAVMLSETLRLRYRQRILWIALGGTLALAIITTVLLLQGMRTQRALRKAVLDQSQAEQALRSRTRELTISNEELQAFAYSISHDIQEPLRMIALYTQLFERRCPPTSEDGQSYLKTIRTSALRMQEMIERLLLLSRIGRSDTLRVKVDLKEIIATVLQEFAPAIAAASAEVTVGTLPVVEGWPDRLHVLFQNLLGNALKYRRSGVPLHVSIAAVECEHDWEIAVHDNGIGFDQQYAEKIFGVFKRLHVSDKYGGTGVGLAISRRIVERHGGRIWAEGRLNEGSTFYVSLPKKPLQGSPDDTTVHHLQA